MFLILSTLQFDTTRFSRNVERRLWSDRTS